MEGRTTRLIQDQNLNAQISGAGTVPGKEDFIGQEQELVQKRHVPEIKYKNSLKPPSSSREEPFDHNHQECIKSESGDVDGDVEEWLKPDLDPDRELEAKLSAMLASTHLELGELPELPEVWPVGVVLEKWFEFGSDDDWELEANESSLVEVPAGTRWELRELPELPKVLPKVWPVDVDLENWLKPDLDRDREWQAFVSSLVKVAEIREEVPELPEVWPLFAQPDAPEHDNSTNLSSYSTMPDDFAVSSQFQIDAERESPKSSEN